MTLTTDAWADPVDFGFADTTFADDGVDNGTAWYVDEAYDGRRIAPLEPFSAFRGEGALRALAAAGRGRGRTR